MLCGQKGWGWHGPAHADRSQEAQAENDRIPPAHASHEPRPQIQVMSRSNLEKALRCLPAWELVDLARSRAHLTRFGVPAAPVLAAALDGELGRRHLQLQEAALLAYSAARLGPAQPRLDGLASAALRTQDSRASVTLLNAYARVHAEHAPRALCAELLGLVLRDPAMSVGSLAVVFRAGDTMQLSISPDLLELAAARLLRALRASSFAASPRDGEALAALCRRSADSDEHHAALAGQLVDRLFWWRRNASSEALTSLSRSFTQLLYTRVGDRAVWDLGFARHLHLRAARELSGIQLAEMPRLLESFKVVVTLRAMRPALWRSFLEAVQRSLAEWDDESVARLLPQLVELVRRCPFPGLTDRQLLRDLMRMAGPAVDLAPPLELARLLHSLQVMLSPAAYREVLLSFGPRLRRRLRDAPPALLSACCEPGDGGSWPAWWRQEVLRPWAAELRRLRRALVAGPWQKRSLYERELRRLQLSDLGDAWQLPLLRSLGATASSAVFARRALRAVLRRRRALDASSPWALRALGFVAWDLGGVREDGKLVSTATREMSAELDADKLLSVDLGFLERRYRRHGDLERIVLLELLERSAGRQAAGTVDLFVDRPVCISCLGVIAQFRALLPMVQLRFAFLSPPFFSREPSQQRLQGVIREEPRGTSLEELDSRFWDP
ncbi:unnamed protein product [Effrenium voratum]|nr:unnamed protein product [Effrenium voratum]